MDCGNCENYKPMNYIQIEKLQKIKDACKDFCVTKHCNTCILPLPKKFEECIIRRTLEGNWK